jgi:hypothetical protein
MAKQKIGGGDFLNEQEKKIFRDMLSKHGKAFASSPDEIGCVQLEPNIVYCDVTEQNRVAMSRHRHNVASRHYDGSRRCC